jgi:transcriptional regulator with XRE-family HTH domain
MEFGEQIKSVRTSRDLTQEQFAGKLNVTRQAVSNWENNRNLPDIEMLIQISTEFHVSLDQLILGGTDMNKMTEKLIKDGSETRKAKMNMVSTIIGAALMLVGFVCLIIKSHDV